MSADWSGLASSLSRLGDQHRQKANFDLQTNTSAILQDVKKLQDRRSALQEGDPEIKNIDDSLANHQRVMTELLAHHKVAPEEIAGLFSSAAGTAPKDPYLTPEELRHKARIAAGLEPQATADKPEAENWVPQLVTLPDKSQQTLQRNSKSGKWQYLDGSPVPPDVLRGANIVPKAGGGGGFKGKEAEVYENKWGKKLADWLPEQLKFFNQEMAYESAKSGEATTTKLMIDQNNQVIPVQVPSEHTPGKAPVEDPSWTPGGASVPKTPGEAKQKAAKVAPKSGGGGVHVGKPLDITAKNSVEQAAHKTYVTAYQLSQKADDVAKNPNDAVNQKRLAVALERIAAGRFTTQALDYIVKAGWGNTIEQWANSTTTGALPKDVMRQLIDGAHQEKDSAYSAWQEARKPSPDADNAPQSSGKAVSLAAAKQLPQNKGKSDDEITKDIKAHGHQVIP